jgi:hypothetical protein
MTHPVRDWLWLTGPQIRHVGNARLLGLSSVAEAVREHSLLEPPSYGASALDITVVVGTTIEIWL